jgi:hypothetical protein
MHEQDRDHGVRTDGVSDHDERRRPWRVILDVINPLRFSKTDRLNRRPWVPEVRRPSCETAIPDVPAPPSKRAETPSGCLSCGGRERVRDGECSSCRQQRHTATLARLTAGLCT